MGSPSGGFISGASRAKKEGGRCGHEDVFHGKVRHRLGTGVETMPQTHNSSYEHNTIFSWLTPQLISALI